MRRMSRKTQRLRCEVLRILRALFESHRGVQGGERMSTTPDVIIRRDAHGVILRYVSVMPRHVEQKNQPSDRLRCAVLRAGPQVKHLRTMIECLEDELSSVALQHFEFAFRAIETAFDLTRAELGLRVDGEDGSA
jgi:hypothetical protein